jgi:beta-galactosidase
MYGNHRPHTSGEVTLTLTGPATLIGDNPFPFTQYGAAGGAFIRSRANQPGTIRITAEHPALGTVSTHLTSTPTPTG